MKKIMTALLLISMLTIIIACKASNTIDIFEIYDYNQPESELANVHDDHWDGSLPTLRLNETLTLGFNVKLSGNDTIDFYSDDHDYSVIASIKDDSRTDLMEIENQSNRINFIPLNEGITEVIFTLYEGNDVVFTTPSLYFMVYGEADEVGHTLDTFELMDVDQDLELGYVHGDHWHGGIGQMELSETLTLSALIIDEGETIDLSSDTYRLAARVVQGSNQSVVTFEQSGDAIVVRANETGTTQIVFQLFLEDVLYYQTPPTSVRVVE